MPSVPTEHLDRTLALWRQGYDFIGNRCRRHGSDIVRTRLMMRPVTLIRGAAAASMFYTPGRFTRVGAMPVTVLKLLQDYGSVQMLDGDPHRHRKALFLEIFTQPAADRLGRAAAEALWQRWERVPVGGRFVLFDEIRPAIAKAVCQWSGVPVDDLERRTAQLSRTIGNTGRFGPGNWRAMADRSRLESWCRDLIRQTRERRLDPPEPSALARIAAWRTPDGALLDVKSGAVELLNVLRPAVAVAWFAAHAGKALHEHGDAAALRAMAPQERLQALERFAQEVRRLSPFFPFIGGRARAGAVWNGYRFKDGEWVLLDLHDTNRDPQVWQGPERFCPARFAQHGPGDPGFVPQGGGDAARGHRCPGEGATVAILTYVLDLMVTRLDYAVPDQDLGVDLSRIPALPQSGFVMTRRA